MDTLLTRIRAGLRLLTGFFRRTAQARRFDEEARFHLEEAVAANVRAGMTPAEARRVAGMAFGGQARFREEAVDETRSRPLAELGHDLQNGVRTLVRAPAFATLVVVTMALGIGATTVFFSIADHVVLRPLRYPEAGRLVVIRESVEEIRQMYPTLAANAGHYLEWRRRCTSCAKIGAVISDPLTLTGRGQPELIGSVRVSSSLLSLLGARAALGRVFTESDDQAGAERVAIVSDRFWRERGADPAMVGGTLTLDGLPWTVVGVMAPEFELPKGQELGNLFPLPSNLGVYRPLALTPGEIASPGNYDYAVIAQRREGTTPAAMESELDLIAADLSRQSATKITLGAVVIPMRDQVTGSAGRGLVLLLAAVVTVLLVLSVNLANLLLARNLGRTREWAVRSAIGAGQGRLGRQALGESVLLAVLGGVIGTAAASVGLKALLAVAPADLPRLGEIRLDGRILAVALALSGCVGLAFGALPALRAARSDPADVLRSGVRTTGPMATAAARRWLIGTQTGLSGLLLIAMGLFLVSFVRILAVDRGFTTTEALGVSVTLPLGEFGKPERRQLFYDEVVARLGRLPGVTGVGVATALPLEGDTQVDILSLDPDPRPELERPVANIRFASPGYFAAIGTPVTRGFTFTEADRGRHVVVLSEGAARLLWPGQDPIGKLVVPGSNDPVAEVIGVVADIKTTSLERAGSPIAYLPTWTRPPFTATILIRTAGDPAAVVNAVRALVGAVAPEVPLTKVRTLAEVIATATAQRRFLLLVMMVFAITAFATASVGIYGTIAHSLAGRRAEIAIRLALGAGPGRLERDVLGEALGPVVAGLAVAIGTVVVLGRPLAGLLYQVSPTEPIVLGGVTAVLLLVTGIAAWIPAHRATANSYPADLTGE